MLALWLPVTAAAVETETRPGARVYLDLTSSLLWDGAALNVEYRANSFAVSLTGGAGGFFVADAAYTGSGVGAQLHLLSHAGPYSDVEIALGGAPMWVGAKTTMDGRYLPGHWLPMPLGFLGLRWERPRAPLVRLGVGLGFASAGLEVSVGYHR